LGRKEYWQAGKSVEHIDKVESVMAIAQRFKTALVSE
jgi:hypothetical protein